MSRESEMNDEPDIIAIHDQAAAEVKQKARIVAAYWIQLLAEGLDADAATRLTLSLQRTIFVGLHNPDDDDAE